MLFWWIGKQFKSDEMYGIINFGTLRIEFVLKISPLNYTLRSQE